MTAAHLEAALPSDLSAPYAARALLADYAHNFDPDLLDDGLLVLSELVSNAVRHGEAPISMDVDIKCGRLRIAVRDAGSEMPQLHPADLDGTSGRGLLIVDSLCAGGWGVLCDRVHPGKTIWCELGRSAPDTGCELQSA